MWSCDTSNAWQQLPFKVVILLVCMGSVQVSMGWQGETEPESRSQDAILSLTREMQIQKYNYKNTNTGQRQSQSQGVKQDAILILSLTTKMQIYNPMFGWPPFSSFQFWIFRCNKYHWKLASRCMYQIYYHFNDDGDDVQLTCCYFNETPCMLQVQSHCSTRQYNINCVIWL